MQTHLNITLLLISDEVQLLISYYFLYIYINKVRFHASLLLALDLMTSGSNLR